MPVFSLIGPANVITPDSSAHVVLGLRSIYQANEGVDPTAGNNEVQFFAGTYVGGPFGAVGAEELNTLTSPPTSTSGSISTAGRNPFLVVSLNAITRSSWRGDWRRYPNTQSGDPSTYGLVNSGQGNVSNAFNFYEENHLTNPSQPQRRYLRRARTPYWFFCDSVQHFYKKTGSGAFELTSRPHMTNDGLTWLDGRAWRLGYSQADFWDINLFGIAGPQAYTLACSQGAYGLAGQPVGLLEGKLLPAAQGAYALTGQPVAFSKGKMMAIAQGAYAVTGQAVGLLRGRLVALAQGAYALTGQVAGLLHGYRIYLGWIPDPSSIAGLKFWFKADSLALSDGASVSSWSDSSGNGNTLTEATNPPTYRATGGANGKPCVEFDGVNDRLAKNPYAGGSISQPNTFIAVLDRGRPLEGTTGRQLVQPSGGFGYYAGIAINFAGPPTPTANVFHIQTVVFNIGNSQMWLDGVSTGVSNGGTDFSGGIVMGTDNLGNFFAGKVCEALMYSGVLSSADRQAIEQNLGVKYGLLPPPGYALSGRAVTLARGKAMVVAQGAYALTGQIVNLLRGRKIALVQGAYAYTGNVANFFKGRTIALAQGAYAYTGQIVGLLKGRTIAIAQGAYSVAGQIVNLLRGRRITLVQGAYTYTGQPVTLLKGRTMTAVQGAYVLTGQAVILLRGRRLITVQGAYAYTGQPVTFLKGRTMAAVQGAYAVTGQVVGLLRARRVVLVQGAYTLTGQPATLVKASRIILTQGGYAYTGQPVNLKLARLLGATRGLYALNGNPVSLLRTRKLPTVTGNYALTGSPAVLRRGRTLLTSSGLYVVTGFDVTLISSTGEIWIFYAGQVAQSFLVASIAASFLDGIEAQAFLDIPQTTSTFAITPAVAASTAFKVSLASSALKVEKTI